MAFKSKQENTEYVEILQLVIPSVTDQLIRSATYDEESSGACV